MKTSAATLAFVIAAAACAQPAPEDLNSPILNIDFDLLVVRLAEESALPLIPALRDRKQAAAAAQKVVDLVTAKKAVLIGWPLLTTKNGQRAVVEQVDEVRYATEFDSPQQMKITTTQPANTPAQGAPKVETFGGEVSTAVVVNEGIPTSFETRNTGVTLEIEPAIGPDGKTINLSLVPQHIRLLGWRKAEIEQKDTGKKVVVEQPDFLTHKVTTQLTVQDGDHTLLGVFKVNDPPGQIELFILHTQIRAVGSSAAAKRK